jgi:hypothetical protein
MEVYIAPSAMVSSEVEDNLNVAHRHPGNAWLPQVGLDELHGALRQMRLDILQLAAGEVIYYANSCTPLNQGIYQAGADEGCSAGD